MQSVAKKAITAEESQSQVVYEAKSSGVFLRPSAYDFDHAPESGAADDLVDDEVARAEWEGMAQGRRCGEEPFE